MRRKPRSKCRAKKDAYAGSAPHRSDGAGCHSEKKEDSIDAYLEDLATQRLCYLVFHGKNCDSPAGKAQ